MAKKRVKPNYYNGTGFDELVYETDGEAVALAVQNGNTDTNAQTHAENATRHITATERTRINKSVGLPTYNATNYTLVFTTADGAQSITVDLPIEALSKDLNYDAANKQLVITKQDGTKINVPMSDLIDDYTGGTTTEATVAVDSGNVIKVTLNNDSIPLAKLATDVTTLINGKASTAVATTSTNGLMSAADKSKLNGMRAGTYSKITVSAAEPSAPVSGDVWIKLV